MNKYNRKQINQKASLHDKEFVTVEDAQKALMMLASTAVDCGADESKLIEFFSGDSDE